MAICRKVFGFHKPNLRDKISFSQLRKLTGIASNATICRAVEELGEDIEKEIDSKGITWYSVRVTDSVKGRYNNCKGTVTETVNTKETLKENSKEILLPSREAIGYYQNLYIQKTGIKPSWDGKAVKLLKIDLGRLELAKWKSLVDAFFRAPTEFVKKFDTGYAYNIFHCQIEKLVQKQAKEVVKVKVIPCDVCGSPTEREFGYQVCKEHGRREDLG